MQQIVDPDEAQARSLVTIHMTCRKRYNTMVNEREVVANNTVMLKEGTVWLRLCCTPISLEIVVQWVM